MSGGICKMPSRNMSVLDKNRSYESLCSICGILTGPSSISVRKYLLLEIGTLQEHCDCVCRFGKEFLQV
jgi:hypothetical protein